MTAVGGLDHVTLCCAPAELAMVRNFYEQIVGLKVGPRPAFDFPGLWLYANDQALVHLAAVLEESGPGGNGRVADRRPGSNEATGSIDHFAIRIDGEVAACREHLRAHAIAFSEAPVPGLALHQLFIVDPLGVKIELNFELAS